MTPGNTYQHFQISLRGCEPPTRSAVRSRARLVVCLVTVFLLCFPITSDRPTCAAQGGEIVVSENVHVSKDREEFPHAEVILAADPSNANRLLAGSMIGYEPKPKRGAPHSQSLAYRSDDGGRTWELCLERRWREDSGVPYPQHVMTVDPAVAFGPDGSAYFTTYARKGIFHSADGGAIWQGPTGVDRSMSLDREYLQVDCTRRKSRGNLYWNSLAVRDHDPDIWEQRQGIALFVSRDQGKTFGPPTTYFPEQPLSAVGMGNSVVLSDATLAFLCSEAVDKGPMATYRTAELKLMRSVDCGVSMEEDKATVGRTFFPARSGRRLSISVLAVDPGSRKFKDRLYAVWGNWKAAGSQIVMATSSDKGLSWSEPIVIAQTEQRKDDFASVFLPTVAVSPDGVVGVSWYDVCGIPNARGWNIRFRASLDGGEHWLPSTVVNAKPMLFEKSKEVGFRLGGPNWAGDTAGLAASRDGTFHAMWIDNRTGIRQAWTARIAVKTDRPRPTSR